MTAILNKIAVIKFFLFIFIPILKGDFRMLNNEAISALKFSDAVMKAARYDAHRTYTENGAVALDSTFNPVLDLFSVIGALRSRSANEIIDLIDASYKVDPLMTVKIIFYARDIRGGLGERGTFRLAIKYLADNHPESMVNNIKLIPEFGRYDDLYYLVGTKLEDNMWAFMKDVHDSDLENMEAGKPVTLLAKWMKTPDTSSKESRRLARLTSIHLGYSNVKLYTLNLRKLRKYIKVLEVSMTNGEWNTIDYSAVPSRAAMIYRGAFTRHDNARYSEYISAVNAGKETIHADTLYPYDIYNKCMASCGTDPTLEALWNALPNYVSEDANALVMADVSGSMTWGDGMPIAVSVSLALYFAERTKGPFANLFMTFSADPQFVAIEGKTLYQKIRNIRNADWYGNTDIEAAFNRILDLAVSNNCKPEELPKSLIIISDMEFDCVADDRYNLMYDVMRKRYADAGYNIPNIVFWNVNSRHNTFQADAEQKGVQLVSGSSASSFKSLMAAVEMTPVEYMLSVINSGRYDAVTIEEAE